MTTWPPKFVLDQERILNLLTGDRFYSDPGAALREAVLNAIDATERRRGEDSGLTPAMAVRFDRDNLTVTVEDNGVGMDRDSVVSLFTTVGASAANLESGSRAVGEFGIGVISYFMAADEFDLETVGPAGEATGLRFDRSMLAGGTAVELPTSREQRGTSVTLRVRDTSTFEQLLSAYPHWCRDVAGLRASLWPEGTEIAQAAYTDAGPGVEVDQPDWVERARLHPIDHPQGWNTMNGESTVGVLYRGVFVQEFSIKGPWGIRGSIDVDPKHFKPRLNREGFVTAQFEPEVTAFLKAAHPPVLEAMAEYVAEAFVDGELRDWDVKRWASLWLSVPRTPQYKIAADAWDDVFRSAPAFQRAARDRWEPVSLGELSETGAPIYVAPLAEEKPTDVIKAAVHLLRNTGRTVIRGIRKDRGWMQFAPHSFATTGDLIASVFSDELPPLVLVTSEADQILGRVAPVAPLFTGPPSVNIVRLGVESAPALRIRDSLAINIDHDSGAAMARGALDQNRGPGCLVELAARYAHEQLSEVAAAIRKMPSGPGEVLSPVRRRYIQRFFQ